MIFLRIVAAVIVFCVICLVVKHIRPEFTPLVLLCSVIIVFTLILEKLNLLIEYVTDMVSLSDIVDDEYIFLLIKVLGITLITKIASEMCKDSGNSVLAVSVEFAGKVMVLIMCMPLFKIIVELATGLLK